PLFEIVGCTSTDKTFGLGFVWALQQVQMLLMDEDSGPNVIVTDRDAALMSAIPNVFLNATPLVCRFHVKKNVSARCSALCKIKHGRMRSRGKSLTR
ncbi:protein FAR1-RELATED SEQUENCE 5-like, partial [Trifolium medium]|nr:protein FAR1-RELATED SEQUENCE 5-like [Trifolium medium]